MLNNLDQQIFVLVTENRSGFLTAIFSGFSFLGNWQFIVFASLLVIIILFVKKKLIFIAPFILTVLGSAILTFLGKIYFIRPRPLSPVFLESGFSFPSGHATVAVAFFAYLAFMIATLNGGKKTRLIYGIAILIIILIGFSRIYLGAHYLSDVLAGYLIGLMGLISGTIWTQKLILKSRNK